MRRSVLWLIAGLALTAGCRRDAPPAAAASISVNEVLAVPDDADDSLERSSYPPINVRLRADREGRLIGIKREFWKLGAQPEDLHAQIREGFSTWDPEKWGPDNWIEYAQLQLICDPQLEFQELTRVLRGIGPSLGKCRPYSDIWFLSPETILRLRRVKRVVVNQFMLPEPPQNSAEPGD